jgi:acetyl esterase/lipase
MSMNGDTMRRLRCVVGLVIFFTLGATSWAQLSEAERWAAQVENAYEVEPNVTYLVANNYEAKLDVYYPPGAKAPVPVVMTIHGGGWIEGTKEASILGALPYLQMGFAVVNVEYRLAKVSPAPAAVEDCLCALHWIGRNAQKYHFDLSKVIVTGDSAGGHLALTTTMIPFSAGFENECAADDDDGNHKGPWTDSRPKVAAVINWYGITDVADILQGPRIRSYAVTWLGSVPNREDLARRLSPLTYVRAGLPPVLTIHGDADRIVPYSHAIRLHDALNKAGVQNQLLTIPGGDHGDFTADQQIVAFEAIRQFLAELGITAVAKQ